MKNISIQGSTLKSLGVTAGETKYLARGKAQYDKAFSIPSKGLGLVKIQGWAGRVA
jgi:hypothetical protein